MTQKNPSWWNDSHSSGWERTKEALHRDWEQTKADFKKGAGQELRQGADDTVKQAAGKEAIPPAGTPNTGSPGGSDWAHVEPAVRYGFGARHHYKGSDWDDDLETKLHRDWETTGSKGTWEEVKSAVKRGWESVKHAV
jgi:hypothetical protein